MALAYSLGWILLRVTVYTELVVWRNIGIDQLEFERLFWMRYAVAYASLQE